MTHETDCATVLQDLPWHANRTLPATRQMQIRAHLAQCAACRNEAELLADIRAAMPVPETVNANGPFSELLERINRKEERKRRWQYAAGLALVLAVVAAASLPQYLFEPKFRTATDASTMSGDAVLVSLRFADGPQLRDLTELLEKHPADIVSGPDAEGHFLLEFRLAGKQGRDELLRELANDPRIVEVRLPGVTEKADDDD